MNKKMIRILFLMVFHLVCIFQSGLVYPAEVRVHASVDRTRTTPDTPLRLKVTIQGGKGSVDTSNIKDFKVVSRGYNSSTKIINQDVTRELIYNYTLFPLKTGRLMVPRLSVFSGNKTYKTSQIEIYVSDTDIEQKGPKKYFVTAEILKKIPYLGQQIIYTFKLYHAVQVRNVRFQEPQFKNFTARRLENQKNYQTIMNHVQYQVIELSWVLVPLKTGKQLIDPSILQCSVAQPGGRRKSFGFDSFFDDPFFNRGRFETKILKTDHVSVQVKPLPEYRGKIKYSGLVGKFDINAELKENHIKVGDSTTLSIILSGNGNIMDAQEMDFKIPKAFKIYKDTPDEDVNLGLDGFYGKKIFRFALVPIQAGTFQLPKVKLNYFDVSSGTYRIKSGRSLVLKVIPSDEDQADSFRVHTGPGIEDIQRKIKKKRVEFTGRDILPLKEGLTALENRDPLTVVRFAIYILVPLFVYLILRFFIILTQKKDDPSSIMARRAETLIKNASKMGNSNEDFSLNLYRALISAILSKSGATGESLTYLEAEKILRDTGCDSGLAEQSVVLLERIESIKYGGVDLTSELKKDILSRAGKIIREILS